MKSPNPAEFGKIFYLALLIKKAANKDHYPNDPSLSQKLLILYQIKYDIDL